MLYFIGIPAIVSVLQQLIAILSALKMDQPGRAHWKSCELVT